MQEIILTKIILYAPAGILLVLLILVPILAGNLRQMKKINKKLSDTLKKAEDYFTYILEEEESELIPVEKQVESKVEKNRKKAEDAELFQEVLMEYFP